MKKSKNKIREVFVFLSEHEKAFSLNQLMLIRSLNKDFIRNKTLSEKQLTILNDLQKMAARPDVLSPARTK